MIPPNPTYVYKILPPSSPPPDPLPDVIPPSDLDKEHGFIHLSTSKQIQGTLKLVFPDADRVYLLKIDYSKIAKDVKWEEGSCVPGAAEATGRDLFPHLHNGLRLGNAEIVSVAEWKRSEHAGWAETADKLREDGWLVF